MPDTAPAPETFELATDSGTAHVNRDESRVFLRLPRLEGDEFDSIIELDLDDLHRVVAVMLTERDTPTNARHEHGEKTS